MPGPQSALPPRGKELRTAGSRSRTSQQRDQENRHTGAMMEAAERRMEGGEEEESREMEE